MDAKERRKRVMARSIKLGHCVCDPRKPCPCPLLVERNICTCAGERVPLVNESAPVRLTDFVRNAGCASKINQNDLHQVLDRLPQVSDPRIVVGMATADDAGVFRLTPDVTLVQTVDVFTPGVDDPYLFGRIAACNSLSDVYAMGGTPVTALSIIGFPIHSLPHSAMSEILRGSMDTLKEAGAVLLGGHSINDEEVKFGLAVTGLLHGAPVTNAGARPGDVLILTKPIGTGILALAGRIGKGPSEGVRLAHASMSTLNKSAAEVMRRHNANAGTDVTGFGLLGHLVRLAMESKVTVEIGVDSVPLFPGVFECARQGMFAGANDRNAEFAADRIDFEAGLDETWRAVLHDPQTSGGLLMSIPEPVAQTALKDLRSASVTDAAIIGRVVGGSDGRIRVKGNLSVAGTRNVKEKQMKAKKNTTNTSCCGPASDACCSGHDDAASGGGDTIQQFKTFIGATMKPGAVDVVTKELIAVALSLAVHCVTCAKMHIRKSLEMGVGKQELEEAAAIAVAFGGCRALMLWTELKQELLK